MKIVEDKFKYYVLEKKWKIMLINRIPYTLKCMPILKYLYNINTLVQESIVSVLSSYALGRYIIDIIIKLFINSLY